MADPTPNASAAHALRGAAHALPWPAQPLPFGDGHIALYDSADGAATVSGVESARGADEPPLLVVHSVNAAPSAFEFEPFLLRQARRRRVLALDLPGFGASGRPDIRYSPAQMRDAILAAIDGSGAASVDLVALSLGCEFATEAVLARPDRVRSLALVSPTGMEGRRIGEKYEGGRTREVTWLRRWLRGGRIGEWLYSGLTRRPVMNLFLSRTFGRSDYDKRLLDQARACAQHPGARHAALDFVSGALFTRGIVERYRALPVPLWVANGSRGSFTDFDACPEFTGTAASGQRFRVQRHTFESGAMPHFELPDDFDDAYQRFLFELKYFGPRRHAPGAAAVAPARRATAPAHGSL